MASSWTIRLSRWRRLAAILALGGLLVSRPWTALALSHELKPEASFDLFRNIFYSQLIDSYQPAAIEQLILYPVADILAPLMEGIDPQQPFAELDKRFAAITPKDLYEEGQHQGFSCNRHCEPSSRAPREPATIVLAAGIFNEMADVTPFDGVLKGDSSFKRQWQQLLAKLSPAERRVKVYSLAKLGDVEVDIGTLFEVGSIDAPDGKAVVRYIFIHPAYGTLTTVGSLDFMVASLERRLDYLATILPPQPHLYLAGYSQGANIMLHLAATHATKEAPAPWFSQIKGILTIGGPLFGTDLADQTDEPGQASYEYMQAFQELHTNLADSYSSFLEIPLLVANNTLLWQRTMTTLAKIYRRHQNRHKDLDSEASPPKLSVYFEMATNYGQTLFGQLTQGAPAWEYFANIKRLKILIAKSMEAIRGLRTSSRLAWWQTHQLPPHLKYLSLAGVMASAQHRNNDDPLRHSSAYGLASPDFSFLRATFYDIYLRKGIDLNDSQVTVREAFFWPKIHHSINPQQPSYEAYNLAILATHHWGLTIPGAFLTTDFHANPFPRVALLKALGLTMLALDSTPINK